MNKKSGTQNQVSEWSFQSQKEYSDPFNDVELDVVFTDENKKTWKVPAYWAGEQEWRVRFAPPGIGEYSFLSECSDEGNKDLHGQTGILEVSEHDGDNPLLIHGKLQCSENKHHLEYADGTPFFWLGDTWWMGLCKRLKWPDEFQILIDDRVKKGFSVIQIIAGLYPDMPAFDERGANEAGFPWEEGYSRINPAYFDKADQRIEQLVESGLLPCIVGCWGYFLPWMGVEKMKKHWRNLVARYGAYPVVWCLAGEAVMPYYLSEDKERDAEIQKNGWTELTEYVRSIDPFHNPVTIHPTRKGREQVNDPSLLDFEMLQTGHGSHLAYHNTIESVTSSVKLKPEMPVLVAEVCYEGIMEASRQEIQRLVFWGCMLSGAAGHTYGANGIWQLNRRDKPYGPSPHGRSWGDTPWEDAYRLPGSGDLGVAKGILEQYPWWRLEPHPEWVRIPENCKDKNDYFFWPVAAGIPGELRVIYFSAFQPLLGIAEIEKGISYSAVFINPSTGEKIELGNVDPDENGNWTQPISPIFRDWVLILEAGK